MIVFDESIDQKLVIAPFAPRYKGQVLTLPALRPGSVIKDDAIPELLLRIRKPTFVTINVADFWMKIRAHPGYCIVCMPLPVERQDEMPRLLIRFLRHPSFRTSAKRIGKVVKLTGREISFYSVNRPGVEKVDWPK